MNNLFYLKVFVACLIGIFVVFLMNVSMNKEKEFYENNKSIECDSPDYINLDYNNNEELVVLFQNGAKTCIDLANQKELYIPTEQVTENPQTTILDVPPDNDFYSYMDYRCITAGDQLQLQNQAYTDWRGIRRVGDDVCVALGSYYGTEIGTRYIITTDKGNTYTAVLADCKTDCHTDELNQFRYSGSGKKNVVEFVVDTYSLSNEVTLMGNVGIYEEYSCEIIKIERIDE